MTSTGAEGIYVCEMKFEFCLLSMSLKAKESSPKNGTGKILLGHRQIETIYKTYPDMKNSLHYGFHHVLIANAGFPVVGSLGWLIAYNVRPAMP